MSSAGPTAFARGQSISDLSVTRIGGPYSLRSRGPRPGGSRPARPRRRCGGRSRPDRSGTRRSPRRRSRRSSRPAASRTTPVARRSTRTTRLAAPGRTPPKSTSPGVPSGAVAVAREERQLEGHRGGLGPAVGVQQAGLVVAARVVGAGRLDVAQQELREHLHLRVGMGEVGRPAEVARLLERRVLRARGPAAASRSRTR